MSRQMHKDFPEFPCPYWVFDPTLLRHNVSHYMVDIITNLRTVDRRYLLRRAWLGNDLSPRERAQLIMQHMEHKPWLAPTEEEFEICLTACIRPGFIMRHEALLNNLFALVSPGIHSFNREYRNAAYMKLCLEFRAYFETVLTLVLVEEDEVKERHFYVDNNHSHSRNTQSSSSSSDAIAAPAVLMNTSRSKNRNSCWESSPLESLMDLPAVQQLRGQQQSQANTAPYSEQSTGMPRLERNRERQPQLVHRTDAPRTQQQKPQQGNNRGHQEQSSDTSQLQYQRQSQQQQQQMCRTNDIIPQPQQGQQQQKPQKSNDCCYVEQSTGGTWLERHGITATKKPEPKPKRRRSALGRLAKKVNTWLIPGDSGE